MAAAVPAAHATSSVVASAADCVSLWDFPGSTTPLAVVSMPARTNCIRWSSNNQTIASVGDDGVIRVTHAVTGASVLSINVPGQDGKPEVLNGVAFSSSSRFLATGGSDHAVKIWDLKKRLLMRSLKGHSQEVTCVSFSGDDREVASGSKAGDVFVHQFSQEQASSCLTPLKLPSSCSAVVRAIQYAPLRRQTLAACRDDGSLQVWDTSTGATLLSMTGRHAGAATAVAFSPLNSVLLATVGLDSQMLFYDLDNRKLIKNVSAEEALTAVAFTNDGSGLVVGSTRGRVLLYDLRQAHAGPVLAAAAHTQPVACIAVQHRPAGSGSRASTVSRPSEVSSLARSSDGASPTDGRPATAPPATTAATPSAPAPASRAPAEARPPAGTASLAALAAARVSRPASAAAGPSREAASPPRGPAPAPSPAATPGGAASGSRPALDDSLLQTPSFPSKSAPRTAASPPDPPRALFPAPAASASPPPLPAVPSRPASSQPTPAPASTPVPPAREPVDGGAGVQRQAWAASAPPAPKSGSAAVPLFSDSRPLMGTASAAAPASAAAAVDRAAAALASGQTRDGFEAGLVRSVLEEVVEESRREARAELQAMHVDMLRCFHELQSETSAAMRALAERVQELSDEVVALRRESERTRASAVFS